MRTTERNSLTSPQPGRRDSGATPPLVERVAMRRGRSALRAGGEFAPGGSHRVSFEGTRDDGQRLEPGVYFLRVNGADGPLASRFLLIR